VGARLLRRWSRFLPPPARGQRAGAAPARGAADSLPGMSRLKWSVLPPPPVRRRALQQGARYGGRVGGREEGATVCRPALGLHSRGSPASAAHPRGAPPQNPEPKNLLVGATGAHGALERRARPHGAHAPAPTSRVHCRDRAPGPPGTRRCVRAQLARQHSPSSAGAEGDLLCSARSPAAAAPPPQPLRTQLCVCCKDTPLSALCLPGPRSLSPGTGEGASLPNLRAQLPRTRLTPWVRPLRDDPVLCQSTRRRRHCCSSHARGRPLLRAALDGTKQLLLVGLCGRAKKIGWLILGN